MDVPEPNTVNCREAMVGWEVAKIALDSSPEVAACSRAREKTNTDRILTWNQTVGAALRPARRRLGRLLRLSLLGHLLRGHFGNFHERELQAADHFNQQIVVFLRQIPARLFAQR